MKKKSHYLLIENLLNLYLNKFEYPSSKDALCQVWLKLAQWFIHANFSKSPWGIVRVATFRRTKNLRRFVVMLDYCTIF